MKNASFTLIELMITLIIVGLFVIMSMPMFEKVRERSLDKEAIANLRLIQSAERIYSIETGVYLACNDTACINDNLRLSIPTGSSSSWDYATGTSMSVDEYFIVNATRAGGAIDWNRTWSVNYTEEDMTCIGTGCP